MNKSEAILVVLDKQASAIGARTMSLIDLSNGEVYEDCYLDLHDQEHNAQTVDGDLVLELWFASYKIAGITPEAILETRYENRSFEKITMFKVRVKVELDRVYVGGQRIYIEEQQEEPQQS
ncbi:hypothetical protein D3C80_1812570 [compost metagenome]